MSFDTHSLSAGPDLLPFVRNCWGTSSERQRSSGVAGADGLRSLSSRTAGRRAPLQRSRVRLSARRIGVDVRRGGTASTGQLRPAREGRLSRARIHSAAVDGGYDLEVFGRLGAHRADSSRGGCAPGLRWLRCFPPRRDIPDAEPVELGVTANLAFYGVATTDADFTLLLSNADEPSGATTVIDILPNTPVSLPDAKQRTGAAWTTSGSVTWAWIALDDLRLRVKPLRRRP